MIENTISIDMREIMQAIDKIKDKERATLYVTREAYDTIRENLRFYAGLHPPEWKKFKEDNAFLSCPPVVLLDGIAVRPAVYGQGWTLLVERAY